MAPKVTKKIAKSFNYFFFFQSRSPDLSPLDFFLFGYLKSRVYSPMPTNVEQLIARINEELDAIPPIMIRRACVEELDRRCHLVIEANGGEIHP